MAAHVCILMATWNGAAHLGAQLQSFLDQDHADWSLRVGDDGSADATRDLVAGFAARHPEGRVTLGAGPSRGSAANFLSLLGTADWPAGSFVALSDQDDIWMPGRLTRALERIGPDPAPCIYASRTILADAQGRPLRLSRLHPHPPAFANALVQNVLAGNTIVLNPAAAALARRTAAAALAGPGVPHHDWWLYQVMTGAGARVINDPEPGLYYRQHATNLLGANRGFRKGLSRLAMIWDRRYAGWLDRNLAALWQVAEELTPENRRLLDRFAAWRAGRAGLGTVGVWRQTALGNTLLRAAARVGRL